jgi:GGDEF domain-containing protein
MADATRADRMVLLVAAAFFTAGAWTATKNRHTAELDDARRSARTDALTGLANRRALIDDLADALPDGRPLALRILDLDGFKSVNDAHGHLAGDQVLGAVAERVRHLSADLGRPVTTHAGDVTVRASIGIAVRTATYNTPTDLIHRADLAMYQAKRRTQ